MEGLRYVVLSIMLFSVLLGLLGSAHQFVRRSGTGKANNSLAFLLLTFSFSIFNILLLRTSIFGDYQHLYQLPLWFTLSFGPLLFYYVKYKLFPTYQFRGSDLKHLVLPSIQLVLVFFVSLQPQKDQLLIWQNFIRPIYGPVEYSLFLLFFFLYASFSYRYIRYKLAQLRKQGQEWEIDTANSLRHLVRRLTILAFVYSFFALTDFVAFRFFQHNLRQVEGYTHIGDLALSGMLLWLLLSAYWKELSYVRHWNRKDNSLTFKQLQQHLRFQQWQRDPDLTPLRVALSLKTSIPHIRQLVQQTTNQTWSTWLRQTRLEEAAQLQKRFPTINLTTLAFRLGFRSKKAFVKASQAQQGANS